MINPDEYSDIRTHNVTYFDYFVVEHIPNEIKTFIHNKNIKTNIFRIQAYDSIMCGFFCNGFIDFMLAGKNIQTFFHQITLRKMKI